MPKSTLRLWLVAGMTAAAACSALAGGSVDPGEVMAIVKKNPKLNKEFRGRSQGQAIECTTARVGRNVAKGLGLEGGARVGNAYECQVGKSKLNLTKEPQAKGRSKAGGGVTWTWTD
jgi:hypothetical protein